jgi:hypothetical protein
MNFAASTTQLRTKPTYPGLDHSISLELRSSRATKSDPSGHYAIAHKSDYAIQATVYVQRMGQRSDPCGRGRLNESSLCDGFRFEGARLQPAGVRRVLEYFLPIRYGNGASTALRQ